MNYKGKIYLGTRRMPAVGGSTHYEEKVKHDASEVDTSAFRLFLSGNKDHPARTTRRELFLEGGASWTPLKRPDKKAVSRDETLRQLN